MKALSLWPEWAMTALCGRKTVEWRSWSTDYRGDVLICSSARKSAPAVCGHALCVVRLVDVVPFTDEHMEAACLDELPDGGYAWLLDDLRLIEPFPVKGRQRLFDVDHAVDVVPFCRESFVRFYEPFMTWSDAQTTEEQGREIWRIILDEVI